MDPLWHIELLGWLRATHVDRVVDRFRTQKAGALLAYLALYPERSHPREVLAEMLWPEDDADTARRKLRITLAPLRRQLEPPGVPAGAVILATRTALQLNPALVTTDVAQFEAALDAAAQVGSGMEQAQQLAAAVERYRGELLPGYFEEWVLQERERLAEAYRQALRRLVYFYEQAGEIARALTYARRMVAAAPLWEEAHQVLIRLLTAAGQPEAALRQYLELERLLEQELDAVPEAPSRELADRIKQRPRLAPPSTTGGALPFSPPSGLGEKAPAPDPPVQPSPVPDILPPHAASGRPAPLPLQLTRFFGRTVELAQLRGLLLEEKRRLVTLTGPGGSGKTRLALELAHSLRHTGPGAVGFVSLVDLADPGRILDRVVRALRLSRPPGVDPLQLLAESLSLRPTLLILDSFEHLVTEGAPLVRTLLQRVETLKVLLTSRQRLDLPGERALTILPLATPGRSTSPEGLVLYDSVRLFVDRAQAVRPDFQVTRTNAAAVAALCDRLEGLPLALELAAARAGILTPAQMLSRLERRFDFLVGNRRSEPDRRHHSLWATLDWSYQLLSPGLQRFFARLSVFRGGWTLESAATVCEEPAAEEYLDLLHSASLVLVEEGSTEFRFRLLETLREYAAEQLTPEDRTDVDRRHALYHLDLAERAEMQLRGPGQTRWMERLKAEEDNLRTALDWAENSAERVIEPGTAGEGPDPVEVGLRLAGALRWFWEARRYHAEGTNRLVRLLAIAAELSSNEREGTARLNRRRAARAKALNAAGTLILSENAWAAGPSLPLGQSLLEESLATYRTRGDIRGIARSLLALGEVAISRQEWEAARSRCEESLTLAQRLGDRWGCAEALSHLGVIAHAQCHFAAARTFFENALEQYRDQGDEQGVGWSLNLLGQLLQRQGDLDTARALHSESLEIWRRLDNKNGICWSLNNLGHVARAERDFETARLRYEERQALEDAPGIGWPPFLMGRLSLDEGDVTKARGLLTESLLLFRQKGDNEGIAHAHLSLGQLAQWEENLSAARIAYGQALILFRDREDDWGIVLCLEAAANLAAAAGQARRAARRLGAAEAWRDASGAPRSPLEYTKYQSTLDAVRAALGDEELAAVLTAGRAMSLNEALTEAMENPGHG